MRASVTTAAWVIAINAAGGALGNVIRAVPLADYPARMRARWHTGILLPFFVAAALRTGQGSSTAPLTTISALTGPVFTPLGLDVEAAKALMVLGIGAGSMVVSDANDSCFWVATHMSGTDAPAGRRCQNVSWLITGIVAIVVIFIMTWILVLGRRKRRGLPGYAWATSNIPGQPPEVVGFDPDNDLGLDIVLLDNMLEADESGWFRKGVGS